MQPLTRWPLVMVLLALAGVPATSAAKHPEGDDCLACHETHGKPDCVACHEMREVTVLDFNTATFPQPQDTPRRGDIDGLTGASGDYYYGDASYLNAAYLASRVNRTRGGAKLVSTVNRFRDEDSGEWRYTPNIATFGYGMREEQGRYYVFLDIGRNNTCANAIRSGDMRFSYYEYTPDEDEKMLRNRGARIIGRVDYRRSALKKPDWKTELPGFGVGQDFAPDDVDWEQVGACSLVVEVVGIIPLG